jgi:hypothetical protein
LSTALKEIAPIFERTEYETRRIARSLQKITEVTQQLQASTNEFKVGAEVIPFQSNWEDQVN